MKSLKRVASKSVYDGLLCLALLMPELFPNLFCSNGFRETAVFLIRIVCIIAFFGVIAFSYTHRKSERFLEDKKLGEIDWLYRIYEPLSDLALTICLIIAGHNTLAGVYLFLGVVLRAFTYNEYQAYKEENNK